MTERSEWLVALHSQATRFRAALEHSDRERLPITLQNFPRGSCGDAAPLLGTYLLEQGFGEFAYVCGDRGVQKTSNWSSHAWLEQGGVIVDITADQFPEISERVIVTTDSEWHRRLNGTNEHAATFSIYDPATVARLALAYNEIKSHLDDPP